MVNIQIERNTLINFVYSELIKKHIKQMGLGDDNGVFYLYDQKNKLYKACYIDEIIAGKITKEGMGINKNLALLNLRPNPIKIAK